MICSKCNKRPAVVFMTRIEGENSINEGICLVCAKELGLKPVDDLMKRFGINDEDLEALSDQMMNFDIGNQDDDAPGFERGGSPVFPSFIMNSPKNNSNDESEGSDKGEKTFQGKRRREKKSEGQSRKFLDTYCDNLNRKAIEGRLDRIVGREKEIYRTLQILSRRQKNNPCLIGEAGVGKTAIAEGLALKIVNGDVPSKMLKKELYLLDLTALVAGTQFRGQFESRVKGLISEVKADGNIILFIDEIHNLTGAGDAEGAMNAANILKPPLSRGEIQVIGATTFNEYRKYIESDQALERRFQPVKIEEPSIEDTIEMLAGVKEYYEDYHHVKIPDELLEQIASLSERYITDRFLPDKAIDLLDEAAASRALESKELFEYEMLKEKISKLKAEEEAEKDEEGSVDYENLARIRSEIILTESEIDDLKEDVENIYVTSCDLAKVIELWTGIPANKIEESEYKKVAGLADSIKKKIIGQDEAVELVSNAIKRTRVGLQKRRRPASFIFVGPTGVGKTELVKVLAAELFSGVEPLIRIDMSEYMEKHAVSRLIGSPPGYVGYDEAGQLTEKVRRRPYSVVLFDEIEKAHPDVMNILLQILDEGKISDAQGRTVNFENTIIVMTSNAGSTDRVNLTGFGRSTDDVVKDKSRKAITEFLRPEFISRVDEVVVFNPLSEESLVKIASLMLEEIREPLESKSIDLKYDNSALKKLAELSEGGKYAARDLRRTIRKTVEDEIANILVDNIGKPIREINITTREDKLVIEASGSGLMYPIDRVVECTVNV
ncbi:MAG: ATP-dependent Clp protease ATP-binding subunit [Ruminococcaceae bacterium]|nr:ATP-dependent Clp protease ATP-binding subunit [Oscillospiraceae bacterium]